MDVILKEEEFEDKNIKFDTPNLPNKLLNGEFVLTTVLHIEDCKGNSGDLGCLLVTNLRLIWHSLSHRKHNLSIGFATITVLNTRTTFDKMRGAREVLYVLASCAASRYEFFFTDMLGQVKRNMCNIFSKVLKIYRLYQRTFLYRELKLRCAILYGGQLILLPHEVVFSTLHGVMNLSSDQGNLGVFILTNIRLVWYSDINDKFNLSLSHRQIANVCVRMSKYGQTLVISTTESSGAYILGFRIDPPERLFQIEQELSSLQKAYMQQPDFGLHNDMLEPDNDIDMDKERETFRSAEFSEIDDKQEHQVNSKINNYLTRSCIVKDNDHETDGPVYCKELGFAIQPISAGYTLSDLWNLMPINN